jgi:hypothetical protein
LAWTLAPAFALAALVLMVSCDIITRTDITRTAISCVYVEIHKYAQKHGSLPPSLGALPKPAGEFDYFLDVTALIAGGGAYLGSYLKKKEENWATHEDLNKLITQVAAVTKTAKEIEASISNDVWRRQRSWDIRRDVFFDVLKQLATVFHSSVDPS